MGQGVGINTQPNVSFGIDGQVRSRYGGKRIYLVSPFGLTDYGDSFIEYLKQGMTAKEALVAIHCQRSLV